MGFKFIKKIPSSDEIISMYPITPELAAFKTKRDEEIKAVIRGESDKLLLIIGPCSADNEDSVCDYVNRLAKVQEEVKDKIIIIPRIYTNKPRTTGEGYKGILHQPDPSKEPDMAAGLIALRKMHIRALSESGLPAADEMLYPENHTYLSDVLVYVAVGARSVENQIHRLVASGINIATGMKNPTSGDFSVMLNSVSAAQKGHTFIYQGWEVSTTGNPYAHAVIRGYVNKHGESIPNYHYEDLIRLCNMYNERELQNPVIIVDANHANSNKQYQEQPRIIKEVLHSRKISEELRKMVRGFMVESYLEPGCQKVGEDIYGKSITDPCLGWEESRKLIYEIADRC